ncbi:hypothetical protein EYF80_054966 [Liparis tanakae]|uniref:Uncharacterized protein n=1 Tax=Liparis tanakae TaxID=230148 RepID=A0A4Z2F283_9TELE|nr:hypothetical protein EYF80_054966 [Liparis tanakae]
MTTVSGALHPEPRPPAAAAALEGTAISRPGRSSGSGGGPHRTAGGALAAGKPGASRWLRPRTPPSPAAGTPPPRLEHTLLYFPSGNTHPAAAKRPSLTLRRGALQQPGGAAQTHSESGRVQEELGRVLAPVRSPAPGDGAQECRRLVSARLVSSGVRAQQRVLDTTTRRDLRNHPDSAPSGPDSAPSGPHLCCSSSLGSTDLTTGLLSTHSRKGVSSRVLYTSPASQQQQQQADTSREKSSSTTPSPGLWPSERQNLDTTSRKKALQRSLTNACCRSAALHRQKGQRSPQRRRASAPEKRFVCTYWTEGETAGAKSGGSSARHSGHRRSLRRRRHGEQTTWRHGSTAGCESAARHTGQEAPGLHAEGVEDPDELLQRDQAAHGRTVLQQLGGDETQRDTTHNTWDLRHPRVVIDSQDDVLDEGRDDEQPVPLRPGGREHRLFVDRLYAHRLYAHRLYAHRLYGSVLPAERPVQTRLQDLHPDHQGPAVLQRGHGGHGLQRGAFNADGQSYDVLHLTARGQSRKAWRRQSSLGAKRWAAAVIQAGESSVGAAPAELWSSATQPSTALENTWRRALVTAAPERLTALHLNASRRCT